MNMSRFIGIPRSGPEWGAFMVGLMVLVTIARFLFLDSPPTEALGLGVYQGGLLAIVIMVLYALKRGMQTIISE